jgi:Mg2+ and Co2+ transporter CorA
MAEQESEIRRTIRELREDLERQKVICREHEEICKRSIQDLQDAVAAIIERLRQGPC